MNDENIHIGALLKQFLAYWKIYTPIGIICLIAAVCFLIATPQEYQFTARIQLISDNQGMMSELKMLKSTGIGAHSLFTPLSDKMMMFTPLSIAFET